MELPRSHTQDVQELDEKLHRIADLNQSYSSDIAGDMLANSTSVSCKLETIDDSHHSGNSEDECDTAGVPPIKPRLALPEPDQV